MAPKDSKEEEEKKDMIQTTTTKDSPKRRVNKPMIERRRRERINECLSQLQTLISQLDKEKTKIGKSSKLEKADILEMTVDFVKRSHISAKEETLNACQENTRSQYVAGYLRCKQELQDFLHTVNTIPSETKTSLLQHITTCVTSDNSSTTVTEGIKFASVQSDKTIATTYQNIQPKLTSSHVNVTTTGTVQTNCTTQIGQKIVPSGGNIMLYNQEIPTFVLVPTATLCQPFPVTSQMADMKTAPVTCNIDNTGTGKEFKTYTSDAGTMLLPSCGNVINQGQVVVMPQNPIMHPQSISVTQNCQNIGQIANVNSGFGAVLNVSNITGSHSSSENDVWRPW